MAHNFVLKLDELYTDLDVVIRISYRKRPHFEKLIQSAVYYLVFISTIHGELNRFQRDFSRSSHPPLRAAILSAAVPFSTADNRSCMSHTLAFLAPLHLRYSHHRFCYMRFNERCRLFFLQEPPISPIITMASSFQDLLGIA